MKTEFDKMIEQILNLCAEYHSYQKGSGKSHEEFPYAIKAMDSAGNSDWSYKEQNKATEFEKDDYTLVIKEYRDFPEDLQDRPTLIKVEVYRDGKRVFCKEIPFEEGTLNA